MRSLLLSVAITLEARRQVAVKVLRRELAPRSARSGFLRGIGIAAQLNHPHILRPWAGQAQW